VIGLLCAALCVPGLSLLARVKHHDYRLYAQLSRDWAERASFYDDQLAKLKLALEAVEPAQELLIRLTYRFLSQHYGESSKSAWAWAYRYRARIPSGVRAWYLRTST
jgi:hypothetical protein